jgi:hypothetical protein
MSREAKDLAEQMIDAYGWSVMEDRSRIIEWLEDRALPCEQSDVKAFEDYAVWLLSE